MIKITKAPHGTPDKVTLEFDGGSLPAILMVPAAPIQFYRIDSAGMTLLPLATQLSLLSLFESEGVLKMDLFQLKNTDSHQDIHQRSSQDIQVLADLVNAINSVSRQNQDLLKILKRWDAEGMPATRC